MSNVESVVTGSYTASDMVLNCCKVYSADIVSTKYAHPIDGLKKIHRRIIYCLSTQSEKDAMTALIGDTSKLHQGGDNSIYSAIVRLAQPFSVGEPLVWCPGNYGDYAKPTSAGHPRYLEIASSEFARDIFFNGVYPKSIPMAYSKDFRRQEPLYFIPRIPLALYLNTITIGYAYNSRTPQLSLDAVCDMVMRYIDKGASPYFITYRDIGHLLRPNFPVHNYLVNEEELLSKYQIGEYTTPIILSGNIEVSPKSIKITTLPYGVIPATMFTAAIEKIQKDKKFWLSAILKDVNSYAGDDDHCQYVFEFKAGVNVWDYLDLFKTLFHIEEKVYPVYNFGYDNRIASLSPIELLTLWYTERYKSITSGIKSKQTDLKLEHLKLNAYLAISEHTDSVVSTIKQAENEKSAVIALSEQFPQLTRMQCKLLSQASLSTLTRSSKETLLLSLEKVESELIEVAGRYSKVRDRIYQDAEFFKKKYPSKIKTKSPMEYLGCVWIEDRGVINYTSEIELVEILQRFRGRVKILQKNPLYPHLLRYRDGRLLMDFMTYQYAPKEYVASVLLRSPKLYPQFGIFVDDTLAVTAYQSILNVPYSTVYCITSNFYGITRMGEIEATCISEQSQRKSISRGSKTKYFALLPSTCKDVVVIYSNTTSTNEIRFSRVLTSKTSLGSLATIPDGETVILEVVPINSQGYYVTLDDRCIDRLSYKHLYIPSVKNLMGNESTILVDLNKINSDIKVKKHPDTSVIAVLSRK